MGRSELLTYINGPCLYDCTEAYAFGIRYFLSDTGFADSTLTILIFGWRGMGELSFYTTAVISLRDIRGDETLFRAYAA